MSEGYVARSVVCAHCGAAVPVHHLGPTVECPFCHHIQQLDPRMLAELGSYQARAAGHLEQASRELQQAQTWDQAIGRPGTSNATLVLVSIALILGPPSVISIVAVLLFEMGLLPRGSEDVIKLIAFFSCPVGLIAYFFYYSSGRALRAPPQAPAPTIVRCPGCGAANALQPGQALERCGFCGGALVPTAPVMQAGIEAAQLVAWRAQLARFRAERAAMKRASSATVSPDVIVLLAFGSLVAMGLPTVAWFSCAMMTGDEPYDPNIFWVWALVLGLAAALAVFVLVRGAGRRRWQGAVAALAATLRGRSIAGVSGIVDWLDMFWAGPLEPVTFLAGPRCAGVACVVEGSRALIFLDPEPIGEGYAGKVFFFVAAWIPGVSDGAGLRPAQSAATAALLQELRTRGYVAELNQAGLLVKADPDLVAIARKRPGLLLPAFPAIVSTMVRVARGLGGVPPVTSSPGAPLNP
jgi:hypothetical protein